MSKNSRHRRHMMGVNGNGNAANNEPAIRGPYCPKDWVNTEHPLESLLTPDEKEWWWVTKQKVRLAMEYAEDDHKRLSEIEKRLGDIEKAIASLNPITPNRLVMILDERDEKNGFGVKLESLETLVTEIGVSMVDVAKSVKAIEAEQCHDPFWQAPEPEVPAVPETGPEPARPRDFQKLGPDEFVSVNDVLAMEGNVPGVIRRLAAHVAPGTICTKLRIITSALGLTQGHRVANSKEDGLYHGRQTYRARAFSILATVVEAAEEEGKGYRNIGNSVLIRHTVKFRD